MKSFLALLEKEIIEYKTSFIFVPVIIGLMLVAVMVLSALSAESGNGGGATFVDVPFIAQMADDIRALFLYSLMTDITVVLRVVLALVSLNYVAGAFYNERKDGSDLFWRSLPINQWSQVGAKFLTVSLVLPAVFGVVIIAVQFCSLLLASYVATGYDVGILENIWGAARPIQTWTLSLCFVLLDVLWLAPVYLWFILCSAYSTRAPLIAALIPVIIFGIAESSVFDSHHLFKGFFMHSSPQELMIWVENLQHRVIPSELMSLFAPSKDSLLPTFQEWVDTLTNISTWIGVAVAAVLFSATVWVRNSHPES